jgi:hypothetical protein
MELDRHSDGRDGFETPIIDHSTRTIIGHLATNLELSAAPLMELERHSHGA